MDAGDEFASLERDFSSLIYIVNFLTVFFFGILNAETLTTENSFERISSNKFMIKIFKYQLNQFYYLTVLITAP